jgi:hypothetical protein
MFWVVSKWQPIPGKEDLWRERGAQVRSAMRAIPGIEVIDAFQTETGEVCAVAGYSSEEDYRRIVQDPNGPFEQTIAKMGLEEAANWVSSERGQSLD